MLPLGETGWEVCGISVLFLQISLCKNEAKRGKEIFIECRKERHEMKALEDTDQQIRWYP